MRDALGREVLVERQPQVPAKDRHRVVSVDVRRPRRVVHRDWPAVVRRQEAREPLDRGRNFPPPRSAAGRHPPEPRGHTVQPRLDFQQRYPPTRAARVAQVGGPLGQECLVGGVSGPLDGAASPQEPARAGP